MPPIIVDLSPLFHPIPRKTRFISPAALKVDKIFKSIRAELIKSSLCHMQTNLLVSETNKKLRAQVTPIEFNLWRKYMRV